MAWEHTEDIYKSGVKALLTRAQFDVLLYLSHRVHPRQHFAWPERKEICAELQLSKSAVDDAIGSLARLGFLRTHRRGFDRLNFSIPSIQELALAVSAAQAYQRRARDEAGITQLRDAQRWALRQMTQELRPKLIPDREIAPGRDLSSREVAPGRDLSDREIAPGRDHDRARARSLLWTKEKEKKKGEEKKKVGLFPAKGKVGLHPENAVQVWQRCLRQLELQLPQTTYHTWVHDTTVAGADGDHLIVAAPTQYARDWLQARLTTPAKRVLQQIAGREIDIAFTTKERAHDRRQTETLQRLPAAQGDQPILQEPVAQGRPAIPM